MVYPGEHLAVVTRELWQEVNTKHNLSRVETRSRRKVDTPFGGLLRCGHCGARLKTSFTQRHGTRHVYYVCRAFTRSIKMIDGGQSSLALVSMRAAVMLQRAQTVMTGRRLAMQLVHSRHTKP